MKTNLLALVLAAVVALGCDGTAVDAPDAGADTKPACAAVEIATVTGCANLALPLPAGSPNILTAPYWQTTTVYIDGVILPRDGWTSHDGRTITILCNDNDGDTAQHAISVSFGCAEG